MIDRSVGENIGSGKVNFNIQYRDLLSDQGLCIHVFGQGSDPDEELLRFDCFDHQPHYHYGPEKENKRLMLDKTTEGDSLDWVLAQLKSRFPEMLERAGYEDFAKHVSSTDMSEDIEELSKKSYQMSQEGRRTVIHDRGDVILEAGSIKFGVEYRHLSADEGVAIHVLGDVNGDEVELLTFDCFKNSPHYHYGPRAGNQRLYLDTTAYPDSLRWALNVLKGGKLGSMLSRAGYSDHANGLNPAVLSDTLNKLEEVAVGMDRENNK